MDTAIGNGDFLQTSGGKPAELTGKAELLQQAYIRLKARRGAFPYDPKLGSRMHTLPPENRTIETVLACVEEAMHDCDSLEVVSTTVTEDGVAVEISTVYGNGTVVI